MLNVFAFHNISHNFPHFAMFGAGTILARSATPAPNMGVATEGSEAAKCVLSDVTINLLYIPYDRVTIL